MLDRFYSIFLQCLCASVSLPVFKKKVFSAQLKPSLFMRILSINNFATKLLDKLLSDLYIGVHLKGSKKFLSKVFNRHRKTVFHMKILSIINFTNKLLRSFIVKLLINNIFTERLGLSLSSIMKQLTEFAFK